MTRALACLLSTLLAFAPLAEAASPARPSVSPVQLHQAAVRQLGAAGREPAAARAALEATARSLTASAADRAAAQAALAALDAPADSRGRERLVQMLGAESAPALEALAARWTPGARDDSGPVSAELERLFEGAARQGDVVEAVVTQGDVAAAVSGTRAELARLIASSASDLKTQIEKGELERFRTERAVLYDTEALVKKFRALRDEPGSDEARMLARHYPEVAGYLKPAAERLSYDLDASLFDHVVERALGRKLLGLERRDASLYGLDGLDDAAFQDDARRLDGLRAAGLLPHFRAALLFHDVAKGDPARLAAAAARVDADLALTNQAGALMLRDRRYANSDKVGLFENLDGLRVIGRPRRMLDELAYQLISARGFAGQHLRGEITDDLFAPTLSWIRLNKPALEAALTPGRPQDLPRLLADAFYLFDAVDVAAVRDGLFDARLRGGLREFYGRFEKAIADGTPLSTPPADVAGRREALARRFLALRQRRVAAGEDPAHTRLALDELSDSQIGSLWGLMERFQGWFVEDATSALAPASQLKLLAMSAALAAAKGADTSAPFHVNFGAMMRTMAAKRGEPDSYVARIIESLLRRVSMEDIFAGKDLGHFDHDVTAAGASPLGAVSMTIDGRKAIGFDFLLSPVARDLVGMLRYFESRSAVAFQKVLKDLLDLFQIRHDEFDRVHNEAHYLAGMAAAKNDKAKLMDFLAPGDVVEVGPAGGAVLELLDQKRRGGAPIGKIVGLDVSQEALKDLEARAKTTGASYELVHGDAFELKKALAEKGIAGVANVIFCSVLHEIFSYIPWKGKKFSHESVKAMLGEAMTALKPGGRLIIRDGVIPDDGEEFQIMELPAADGMEFFKAYLDNFEGRPIPHTILSDGKDGKPARIRLMRKDAMEFAYTYTWGPESFPYEVREQYGVHKRADYVKLVLEAAAARGVSAREVAIPAEWKSYLQPGYPKNLEGKLALYKEDGTRVALPPSNMMIVVERTEAPAPAVKTDGPKQVVLIPGDGIGPEVTGAVRKIVDASGAKIDWIVKLAGAAALKAVGDPLPQDTLDAIRSAGVALKGPLATPSGSGYRSINLTLRKEFDLYQNYRPSENIVGVSSVHTGVNLIIVRENLEDLYVGEEREVSPGVVESIRRITYEGSYKIAKAAFEIAREKKRKKVTAVHKANIIKLGDGMFLKAFRDVAALYPDIEHDELIVDAAGERIARRPQTLDVLVTPNVWGDILSDVAAGVVGGLGQAPSATIGDTAAIFEAVHGTAEDIAGKGIANPTAVLRSMLLLLRHIGEFGPADRIEKALLAVLADPARRTGDLGGKQNTAGFTQAVIDEMARQTPAP